MDQDELLWYIDCKQTNKNEFYNFLTEVVTTSPSIPVTHEDQQYFLFAITFIYLLAGLLGWLYMYFSWTQNLHQYSKETFISLNIHFFLNKHMVSVFKVLTPVNQMLQIPPHLLVLMSVASRHTEKSHLQELEFAEFRHHLISWADGHRFYETKFVNLNTIFQNPYIKNNIRTVQWFQHQIDIVTSLKLKVAP